METYDNILNRMKNRYTELSGFEVAEMSDVGVRLRVLAGEIYTAMVNAEWLKRQMFADTAESEYLEYHAMLRGLTRRGASRAVGTVKFSVPINAVVKFVIPEGTVVATSGEEPLLYETTEPAEIAIGTKSCTVGIRALYEGSQYNVGAGKIRVMVTPPAGVQAVTNPEACTSGTDVESDESLRARIVSSFRSAPSGANCAYYRKLAMETDGVVSAGVVPRARGTGTVDVYVAGEGGGVSDEVLAQVQERLSYMREVNVDVKALRAIASGVSLLVRLDVADGYESEDVISRVEQAVKDYVKHRGVGDGVLLNDVGEVIYHVDGVKEYALPFGSNSDVRCSQSEYPLLSSLKIYEGVNQ